MEGSQVSAESTDANERLKEDTNFNSIEENGVYKTAQTCESSAQINSTLTVPEELSRDRSEKALSKIQGSLLIHEGATTVSSENPVLPKETINGPVSYSSNKTSILNADSISLSTDHPVDLQASLCSTSQVVYDVHQPIKNSVQMSSQQVLFLLPDVAHAKKETHSNLKHPTSSSDGCETSNGNIVILDSTLAGPIDECNDGSEIQNEMQICSSAVDSVGANTVNFNTERDSVNEKSDELEKNCVVKVQKKRKRKMDGSKITRCYSEDAYNDVNISKKLKLLNVDLMEQSDEEQLIAPHKYELLNIKSESSLDDTEDHLPKEAIEAFNHYIYSPVCDYSGDTSPVHVDPFFASDVQSCESQSPPTCTSDQEPSFSNFLT